MKEVERYLDGGTTDIQFGADGVAHFPTSTSDDDPTLTRGDEQLSLTLLDSERPTSSFTAGERRTRGRHLSAEAREQGVQPRHYVAEPPGRERRPC